VITFILKITIHLLKKGYDKMVKQILIEIAMAFIITVLFLRVFNISLQWGSYLYGLVMMGSLTTVNILMDKKQ
jgi:hypothetical protein